MLGKETQPQYHYLLALGSNRAHAAYGLPRSILQAAMARLDDGPAKLIACAPIIESRPIGPSLRIYANGAVIIAAGLMPEELLRYLKSIERDFGKRHRRRWSSRTLDLDIILWRGAADQQARNWQSPTLNIPHQHFHLRDFVLGPAKAIAWGWRDPRSGRTIGQLYHKLQKPRPAC